MRRFDDAQRATLIELAEQTIAAGVRGEKPEIDLDDWPAWARQPDATFVTVYVDEQLAGCIGTLAARRPLAQDVAENAYRAAFADPRFAAVTSEQLGGLTVHLAILGPLVPLPVDDEADLRAKMRPNLDGIVLDDGARRGTFLPAVWDKLPDPGDFVRHLKRKAGIGADEWPPNLEVFRFAVEEFDRSDLN